MAVVTFTPRVPVAAVPSRLTRAWTEFNRIQLVYRTRHLLAAMDDRTLADIGVSRAEAGVELDRPIWDAGLR